MLLLERIYAAKAPDRQAEIDGLGVVAGELEARFYLRQLLGDELRKLLELLFAGQPRVTHAVSMTANPVPVARGPLHPDASAAKS